MFFRCQASGETAESSLSPRIVMKEEVKMSRAHPRRRSGGMKHGLLVEVIRAFTAGPRVVSGLIHAVNHLEALGHRGSQPSKARRYLHALVILLLWLPAVVLGALGLIVLARGLLYGLVIDDGGWVNGWGGPTLAGAWAVHALIGVPSAIAAGFGVAGIARLMDRADRRVLGHSGPAWIYPVAFVLTGISVLFLNAWLMPT